MYNKSVEKQTKYKIWKERIKIYVHEHQSGFAMILFSAQLYARVVTYPIKTYVQAPCVKMRNNLEIVSDKKKRVQSRACALTRRTKDDK